MNYQGIIPIVFASDDNYAPYLGVAISSLIRHSNLNWQYYIYILETSISEAHKAKIARLSTKNVKIEFKNVDGTFKEKNIGKVNHFSVEATYRLLIPQMFFEYDKILYLDTDIVILHDVAELFSEDLSEYTIACTRAWLLPDLAKYVENTLQLPIRDYFNSGVMLINVAKFSKLNISERSLKMLSEKQYFTPDQDVLNIICYGNVKYLDARWNVEWGHATSMMGEAVFDDYRHNQLDSMNDPYIVHYSTCYKPWTHSELLMAEYFWQEARQTNFYEEILIHNSSVRQNEDDIFRKFIFPWQSVKPNSNVVIYGGGTVGKTFCKQIEKTRYCRLIAVCDKYPNKVSNLSVPIIGIDALLSWNEVYIDYIVIANSSRQVSTSIREELINYGLKDNIIICESPWRNGFISLDARGRICQ